MRIAVVGIGGVGGYIGAKLCALRESKSKKKLEVVFIARGEHARAIKENGLRIIEDEGGFTASPSEVITADAVTGTFDLLLLCVKSYDIQNAIDTLRNTIRPDTVIIPFSNGVNHAEAIAGTVDAKVFNGCAYILSHIEKPGVICKRGKVFAAVFGSPDYPEETLYVDWLFKQVGLRTKTPEDISAAVWKKYLFISAFASLTSYYDLSIKQVFDEYPAECVTLIQEISAVAAAKGIDISGEIDKTLQTASGLPEEASTSMRLDFQSKRPTELETLSGYVVREAQKYGIAVPLMTQMYHTLRETFDQVRAEARKCDVNRRWY